jgi:hypothetical protein
MVCDTHANAIASDAYGTRSAKKFDSPGMADALLDK